MKEVAVILDGGLGNQMFQFAAAYAQALRLDANLALDVGKLTRPGDRAYGLGDFILSELRVVGHGQIRQPPHGLLRRLPRWLTGSRSYKEEGFAFDPRINNLAAGAELHGYFQSERYFENHIDAIRHAFMPRPELGADIERFAAELLPATATVSLHIRRGDYLNPATAKVHGVLDAGYYERALDIVTQLKGGVTTCVFTDDPAWVREHLRLHADTRFISEHTRSAHQDLILMSRCSHHITANSSFSWWGAWLDPSLDKLVVTPAQWFTPESGLDTRDLRPAGWLQI